MKQTGQLFKKTREQKKISISEVAMATKISARVIERIEAGDSDDMPPLTFLRGFIRSYASYLKLDADEVMAGFNQEMGIEDPAHPTENSQEVSAPEPSLFEKIPFLHGRLKASNAIAVVAILILIAIIAGIKDTIEKYEHERRVAPLVVKENLNDLPEGGPTESDVLPTPDKNNDRVASPKPAVPPEIAAEPTPSESPEDDAPAPSQPPVPVAVPTSKPDAPPAPSGDTNSTDSLMKEPSTADLPAMPQEIILQALDYVEVLFRIDDGQLTKITLKPEDVHAIKGHKRVAMDLSDGGAVNIIHNGKDRGVPGKLGTRLKVVFPGYSKRPL